MLFFYSFFIFITCYNMEELRLLFYERIVCMNTTAKYRFLLHYTLSFIGGFMGLYAIISRSELFGNAQTANLLYLVHDLVGHDLSDMALRGTALLVYMAAVILTVWIPAHFSADLRYISICIDILAVAVLGFLPAGLNPVVALYPVFFAMPFQWCTFKAPGGYNSSTIFSTNNLRQFTSALTEYLMNRDPSKRRKARFYAATLLSFHVGAALALILSSTYGIPCIWFCLIPAFAALYLVSADRRTATVSEQSKSAASVTQQISYSGKHA